MRRYLKYYWLKTLCMLFGRQPKPARSIYIGRGLRYGQPNDCRLNRNREIIRPGALGRHSMPISPSTFDHEAERKRREESNRADDSPSFFETLFTFITSDSDSDSSGSDWGGGDSDSGCDSSGGGDD